MSNTHPIAVAHRAGNHPETLTGVHLAGIDYAEADIWLHNGRLEIRHLKTMGPIPLLWDRWKLVRGWAPRLELAQLLDGWGASPGSGAELVLDLKGDDAALAHAIARQLESAGFERFHITGRVWDMVDYFRDRPGVRLFPSAGHQYELDALLKVVGPRHYAVNIHETLVTKPNVEAIHDRGAKVLTWPINDAASADHVLGVGVDGLISDNFTLLGELVKQRDRAGVT